MLPDFLQFLLEQLVARNLAAYEPAKQTRSVLLYWKTPEEWGEALHEWVRVFTLIGYELTLMKTIYGSGDNDWAAEHDSYVL